MYDIQIQHDVPVPMSDGTVLRADVYRPLAPGPWPVVIVRTPYGKGLVEDLRFADPWLGARMGVIVVVQDVRGRGASEGDEWIPFVADGKDGVDTVAWAADLPDSNGNVGLWGGSYLGHVQWLTAAEHPSALKAIAPHITWQSYEDGLTHRGGAVELGLGRWWGLYTGIEAALRRGQEDISGLITALDDMESTCAALPTGFDDAIVTRHDLPSLAPRSEDAGRPHRVLPADVPVPSLNIGGWFDIFAQGTLDNFVEHSRSTPSRLLIGPWSHLSWGAQHGDVGFGVAADGGMVDLGESVPARVYEWLNAWLTGGEPEEELPVHIFVMGANVWRREATWPLERAVDTRLHLHPDGALAEERAPDRGTMHYAYDPANPVRTLGGNTLMPHLAAGPVVQAPTESRDDVLTFTSAPLQEDVEVTGRVLARLTVATDGPTTDWVVRLCDVDLEGRSINVVDGITRATHSPGEPTTIDVDLWSTSMLFKAGHQIRVQVTSSCFPRWDRNLNVVSGPDRTEMRTAAQTVFLGGDADTYVTLPIVPADGDDS